MSKECLEKLTAKELACKCKELNIPHYHGKNRFKKDEMIEALLNANTNSNEQDNVPEESKTTTEVETNERPTWVNKDKEKYIEEAEVGTLIAFYDKKGKPRTAALVNRSSTRRVVKLVTEFDWEFIVPYEDVLWVRRGTRWPKGVYNLLKGYKHEEG